MVARPTSSKFAAKGRFCGEGRAAGAALPAFAMGITVYYRLAHSGRNPLPPLEALRRRAEDLPFHSVTELFYLGEGEADYRNYSAGDTLFWPLVQLREEVRHKYLDGPVYVAPLEAVVFAALPGRGCEPAFFGLARYPHAVDVPGGRVPTGFTGWRWRSACKTHGAVGVSREHFLRCHYSVCALLKSAAALGLLRDVCDDGAFWESWDFRVLGGVLDAWDSCVKALLEQLGLAEGESG